MSKTLYIAVTHGNYPEDGEAIHGIFKKKGDAIEAAKYEVEHGHHTSFFIKEEEPQ